MPPAVMTPCERICAAMRRQQVDYLPCSIYFNSNLKVPGYDCAVLEDRARLSLDLGVDPFVSVGIGQSIHPDVRISNWVEDVRGEHKPILWQAWETPEGRLTQAVRLHAACGDWSSIQWSDHSASSLYRPLIESEQDVERLRYLFQPMSDGDYELWHETVRGILALAAQHRLPLIATYGQGLAQVMFMMGATHAVLFAVDHPQAFHEIAEIIHQAEIRNIDLAARAGVDVLKRFGGYETTNFYNPKIFRSVCVPRLRREVRRAHELGLLIYYRVVTGMAPLLDDIAGIGFDCIEGGEPCLSRCSLEAWRDAFAGTAASWTGVSTPVLLGGSDSDAVRREVRRGVDLFGKEGFILGVTNSIRNHFPWANTLAMIDEWNKLR